MSSDLFRKTSAERSTGSSLTTRAAFFDVDNTLIDLKSMFSFQSFYWQQRPEKSQRPEQTYQHFVEALELHPERHNRQVINRLFYESFSGRDRGDMRTLGVQWFQAVLRERGEGLWIAAAVALARRLKADGYLLVGVSGSCDEILSPVLAHLGFDHTLATQLEHVEGRFTGRIDPPQMIGAGKVEALLAFVQRHGLQARDCVAVGDHLSDAPMLDAVGTAYVVPGDPLLENLAALKDWNLLDANSVPSPHRSTEKTHDILHA